MRVLLFAASALLLAGCASRTVGPAAPAFQVTTVPPPPTTGTVVVQPDQ